MAEKRKGKGTRSAKQLRALFAMGILRGSGKGKERSVSYNAKRAKSIAGQRKRGVNVTRKYRNTPKGSNRPVIGGSKAAGLRGGGGAGKTAPKSRAERIAAGKAIANRPDVARKALKGTGLRVRENTKSDSASAPLLASGSRKTGMNAKGDTRFLVKTARTVGVKPERGGRFGKTRAARIAAGREKAQAFVKSERGQKISSAVGTLRETGRRTGRRDYSKPEKVKAAKADLKAAGVKVKTGTALSKQYDLPRLRGDYSNRRSTRIAPKYAREKAAAAAKTERMTRRTSILGLAAGKSRAERIELGKVIAARPGVQQGRIEGKLREKYQAKRAKGIRPSAREIAVTRPFRINEGKYLAGIAKGKIAQASAAKAAQVQRDKATATLKRLRGRENRVARGEAKKAAATVQRLSARNRRVDRLPALERGRRIKAGKATLAAFRQRRDSLYSSKLF